MTAAPFHRILHVDDQKDMRDIVRLALGKMRGFAIWSCASGEEALATAAECDPELLLLDVNMPGMDGVELLTRMRKAGINAPAVFFTGLVNDGDFERYAAAGAIGTVAKPFAPLKLADQLIGFWRDGAAGRQPGA